ncbi:5-dehydro-2-deoxygluconokinase [bioreactor metagenome]|uniref:5-dehydro-2-deoxygluconokinase n=1 Tax=bioreactor metagenome TaxID=1076179 RepID=A0A644ZA64_9ZZZZ
MFKKQPFTDEEVCRWFLKEFNLKFLILTAGANYSIIYTPEGLSYIKTPVVNVVDTVGAGDSFTGAFISSILDGKSASDAHQTAVDRAAYVCSQAGAWV